MADLDAAALEDVHKWFKDYYGPNNAVLSLAGDIDVKTAREKVERYFGDIPAGPDVDAVRGWVPVRAHNTHEVQHDQVPAVLANRAWVLPGRATRERALLDLAAAVVGSGRNSRLYLDLIYNRQLATAVSASVTPFELASVFDLSVTLNPDQQPAVASEAIDRLIAEFLDKGPSADELERVVTGINAIDGARPRAGGRIQRQGGHPRRRRALRGRSAVRRTLSRLDQRSNTRGRPRRRTHMAGSRLAPGERRARRPLRRTDAGRRSFRRPAADSDRNPDADVSRHSHRHPEQRHPRRRGANDGRSRSSKCRCSSMRVMPPTPVASSASRRSRWRCCARARRRVTRSIFPTRPNGSAQSLTTGANLDASVVTLSAMAAQLEPSIDLWADVLRNPTFADAEIDRLRGQWIATIGQEKAEPGTLAQRLLPPVLYGPGHAYAVPFTGTGTADSIKSIDRADLVAFKSSWLRPDNASLFIVGDTTLAEVTPLLERALQGWTAPATPRPTKNVATVKLPASPRVILVDKPGSPQSFILAGHLAPGLGTDRDLAIEAMNGVIGGSFTARINMNLREDKGWSYGARTLLPNARGMRLFFVNAPVQTDRTGEALAELIKELDALKTTKPVTEVEMNRVIAGLTRGLPGSYETSGAVLGSLVTSARYGRPLDYAATLTERYRALRLADLQSAANDIVQPQSLIWVIVGDLAQIRGQVEKLNLAPIEVWNDDGQPVK